MEFVDAGDDVDDRSSKISPLRAFAHTGETFHQVLMEDFRFMEAARMESGEYEGTGISTNDLKPMSKLKQFMITNGQGLVNFAEYDDKLNVTTHADKDYVIVTDFRSRLFVTRMSIWPPVSIFAHWLLGTHNFRSFMIFVIICNSTLMAVDGEIGSQLGKQSRSVVDTVDFAFLALFFAEIFLKWIDNFGLFWSEYWNMFDFVVTSMSLMAPMLDLFTQNATDDDHLVYILITIKYIRILRVLRSLNVVTRVEKIMIIWAAIARTAKSLFFITALMFIFFYIFAVIGIQVFDKFTTSHRTDIIFSECFVNIPRALVTLFQLFTLDKWHLIIRTLADGMDEFGVPVSFCLLWILLGSFIFRNIFIGVMVKNFQTIRMQYVDEEDISIMDEQHMEDMEFNVFKLHEPDEAPNKLINDVLIDWEDDVFHNIDILSLCEDLELTGDLWPRDTLFLYYILLESLAWNLNERDILFEYINTCLTRVHDK